MNFFKKIIIFFLFIPIYVFSLEYDVKFSGLKDKAAIKAISRISNLIVLQKRAPKTINALIFRANNDKPQILKVLHSYGYYDAKITIDIEEEKDKVMVWVFISPGARYTIKDVKIYSDCISKKELSVCDLPLLELGIPIKSPLIAQKIFNAQNRLTFLLSTCGYPLAKVLSRDVKIDLTEKNATIEWCVDPGSFSKFGPIRINGLQDIKPLFIDKKIKWQVGNTYDNRKVIETQNNLLRTNLFSSVAILHDDDIKENNMLPMHMKLVEALHKYVTAGISYATIDGFGVSLGWANRNFRSVGELLAIDANIAQRMFLGVATYKKHDFVLPDQDYVLRFEASREKIPRAYLAFNYSMTNRIDKKFSKKFEGSFGATVEYDEITHSANNGNFFLFSLPLFVKYTTANNLLNPTSGYTIIYRASPFKNVLNRAKYFFKETLTVNYYHPIVNSKFLILALRAQLGSIVGASVYNIPLTRLYLGGSDDDLRGYKYRTVSPLNYKNEPIGGRSALYLSIEPRIRLTQSIGLVPFTDLGIVSLDKFLDFRQKWVKSIGLGFRYYSFFGPIRLDIGFPLDRRKAIDSRYKIYVSIGQTF